MNVCQCLVLLGVLLITSKNAQGQAGSFHRGNLIVCSPTGGTSAASVVKLYQYTTSGAIVDSAVIPSTGSNELTISGSASPKGL